MTKFQVTLIPAPDATAFQVHAVAHSSESPNKFYTVKAGIQRTLVGTTGLEIVRFTLLPLGEFRATPLSHCSCLAGQRLQFCKHFARLLQFCVPDFPHFGTVGPNVPQAVHDLAVHCERAGALQQTSSHQRNTMPHCNVDFSAEMRLAPLFEFAYINPHYHWGVRGFTWVSDDAGNFKLVPGSPDTIEA